MGTFRDAFAKGVSRDMTAKAVGTITFASLATWGVISASGATKAVLAKAAVPGAIKTMPVIINGVPYVYSVVKASLLSKIFIGGILVTGAAIAGVLIYSVITDKQ